MVSYTDHNDLLHTIVRKPCGDLVSKHLFYLDCVGGNLFITNVLNNTVGSNCNITVVLVSIRINFNMHTVWEANKQNVQ